MASTDNTTRFKDEISEDVIETIRRQMLDVLKLNGIQPDEVYAIEFGLKSWELLKYGGHQTVVIRISGSQTAFRLDLEFDSQKERAVAAEFKCPYKSCDINTESFREYTKHYFQHFRKNEFPAHQCCEKTFKDYILYCKHMHEKHCNINPVGIGFEQIRPANMDKFLSKTKFFPSGVTTTSFTRMVDNALRILRKFGQYNVLFWNCQDYATWFLSYHGVPMNEIDPTLTDRVSASNTESSARKIQSTKKQWYHKYIGRDEIEIVENELKEYEIGIKCHRFECRFLPSMDAEDIKTHELAAHKRNYIDAYFIFCRKLLGTDFNLEDQMEMRKFSLYELRKRGNKQTSHVSLVFQPWNKQSTARIDHFCRIHIVNQEFEGEDHKLNDEEIIFMTNNQNISMITELITSEESLDHSRLFDFEYQAIRLYAVYLERFSSNKDGINLFRNCGKVCDEFIDIIQATSKVTNETWKNRFRQISLSSLPTHIRTVEYLLPLFILVSRYLKSFTFFFSYWFAIHIVILGMFDFGTKKSTFNLIYAIKEGKRDEKKDSVLALTCCMSTVGLAVYGLVDPENISAVMTWYYTYQIISGYFENVQTDLKHAVSVPPILVFGKELFDILIAMNAEQNILLYIALFSDHFIYLLMQCIFLIAVHGMIHHRRKDGFEVSSTFLGHHKFGLTFHILFLFIIIPFFFFFPSSLYFGNYFWLLSLPQIVTICIALMEKDFVSLLNEHSNLEERLVMINEIISSPHYFCHIDGVDHIARVRKVYHATRVISKISEQRLWLVAFVSVLFVVAPIQYSLMMVAIIVWVYHNYSIMYIHMGFSFFNDFYEFLRIKKRTLWVNGKDLLSLDKKNELLDLRFSQ